MQVTQDIKEELRKLRFDENIGFEYEQVFEWIFERLDYKFSDLRLELYPDYSGSYIYRFDPEDNLREVGFRNKKDIILKGLYLIGI